MERPQPDEDQGLSPQVFGMSTSGQYLDTIVVADQGRVTNFSQYKSWLIIITLSILALTGQPIAVLLGRLYFEKGGKGKWMATLVQTVGFPVLLPFLLWLYYPTNKLPAQSDRAPLSTLLSLYLFLGVLFAGACMAYTFGLQYLPVSMFSLICSSQLAFIALFSAVLNAQKFTPFIINSLVLLTISSVLLVFQSDKQESSTSTVTKKMYAIGFLCTVGASAGFGFSLPLTQLVFRKFLKANTIKVVLELNFFQSMFATVVILIGFFASGEWKTIKGEMDQFELGKVPYVVVLVSTAVSWQVFFMGSVGLIFKVSALFSNVIATVGLPIVPVCAVWFFHDSMNGVKVVSMILAIWGSASYVYQHYLDDLKSKNIVGNEATETC